MTVLLLLNSVLNLTFLLLLITFSQARRQLQRGPGKHSRGAHLKFFFEFFKWRILV